MDEEGGKREEEKRVLHTYPCIQFCDMQEEMKNETLEQIVASCEKYPSNNEQAARLIKETLDKKYGAAWHVVVGEGYGFQISYESKNILYMYLGGNTGVIVWKCS